MSVRPNHSLTPTHYGKRRLIQTLSVSKSMNQHFTPAVRYRNLRDTTYSVVASTRRSEGYGLTWSAYPC